MNRFCEILEHFARNVRIKLHDLLNCCLELPSIHGFVGDDSISEKVTDISFDIAMQQGE
jgi:hypothetical protein